MAGTGPDYPCCQRMKEWSDEWLMSGREQVEEMLGEYVEMGLNEEGREKGRGMKEERMRAKRALIYTSQGV